MDYKWFEIRRNIISACKKTFAEQSVEIPLNEIEKATDMFDRIVSYPIQYPAVANLQADLQQSLQGVYVDNVGKTADLRNVLNLMDAFLKKILVMAQVKSINELYTGRATLKLLLQYTNASATFSGITHQITESNISPYDKDPTGAYIFCKAYLGRNTVHESREMDSEDVLIQLRYAVSAYILVTHNMAPTLVEKYPNLKNVVKIDLSEINETGFIYDFINYGHTSNKIKNRIVESFILNYVYKKQGVVTVESVVKEVVAFSRQSLNENSVQLIVKGLIPEKLEYEDVHKKKLLLTQKEKVRIQAALDGYRLLVERLVTDLETLLDEYNLKEKTQEVYVQLKKFFDDNCLSIIQILGKQDCEASNENSEEYVGEFKNYLKTIGCADEHLDELFRGLLKMCSLNDVLVKIVLGKNFTNISNQESFATGMKQREKKVYLDTQLLLYALCNYDEYYPYNGSPSFLIVKSLIGISRHNPNIHLATINQYVNEAAYHLKRAVQLITFDDIYYKSRIKLSDNVFYSYYYYLKDNGQLNEGIETLADFLKDMFDVSYDDLLQGNFETKYYRDLAELLGIDCGIEVEETPYFSTKEIKNSEKVFTTALTIRNDNRPEVAAKKDAIMGLHLFSSDHKDGSAPFFLSWDKTFYSYRKEYIKGFLHNGDKSLFLFSPAKFVNHLNLLEMKVDVEVLTEDLISIIEDDDTATKTKHVLDSIRKLLERSNVMSRKKRKEYTEIIFNETEFPNDTVLPDEKRFKLTTDFATTFDKVLSMMQSGGHNFVEFTDIIGEETRFKQIVADIIRRLNNESIDQCAYSVFSELEKEVSKESKD